MCRSLRSPDSIFRSYSHLLLAWVFCAAMVLVGPLHAIPISVVFNGVITTLDTGSATLNHPAGVAVDSSGRVYIADTSHNQIVVLSAAGNGSVVSMTGLSPALSAPAGVAVDEAGNLYICDTGNNRVVKVTAGTPSVMNLNPITLSNPQSLAVDSAGNLYIADRGNNRIVKVPDGGTAAALNITGLGTALSAPTGVAVDPAGNLYIADLGNNRVVKVTTGGAGSAVSISSVTLTAPEGVAIDPAGVLYVADTGNNRVVKVTAAGAGSVVSTGSVTFTQPKAVGLDVSGTIYIADTSNSRIVTAMMTAVDFGSVQLGASSGNAVTLPFTVSVSSTLGSVQALTLGAPSLDFTLGAGTTCSNGTTNTTCTVDVTFFPLAAGVRRGAVMLFDQSQNPLLMVPLFGTGSAPLAALSPGAASVISTGGIALSSPFQSAIDGSGNIYVGNYTSDQVVKIAAGGGSASVVNTGGITLNEATGVAVDGGGNLYIGDYGNSRIVMVTAAGAASVLTISGLAQAISYPTALAFDKAGNLYIADYGIGRIVRVTPALVGSVVSTGSYTFSSTSITGVSVDQIGNVYIADRSNNRVIKVTPAGAAAPITLSGVSALTNPQGVTVDGAGNVYIADAGHRRIVQLTNAGIASVVQTPGQTIGTLNFGITVDVAGNLLIADWSNNRLLNVDVSGAALSFANTMVGSTSSDSPKTATVTNLGNQPLIISGNPSYPADFPEYSSGANLCAASTFLGSGEVCNISAEFTPQAEGSRTANVVVTDNSLNMTETTQAVAVSGTAITKNVPTLALLASANPALLSSSVTFTITVSSGAGTPSGSVGFYDGPTLLGTATLASGVATYATSSLTAGTHSITAHYAGDSLFSSATSSAVALIVSDLNLAVATGGQSSATVAGGGTATYSLTIEPSDGSTFPGDVSLSASGAPAGSTVTITPQTLAAGSGATDVTLTIRVPVQSAALEQLPAKWGLTPIMAGVLLLPLGAGFGRRVGKRELHGGLLLLALVSAGALIGCGSDRKAPTPTPPQARSYTITVTATAASLSRATTVTLIVQ